MAPSKQTAGASLLGALLTGCVMQLFAEELASTPALTLMGGFLSAILHFFLLVCLGNLQDESGWATVIFSLFVAACCAATVHPVSMTSGVLLGAAVTYYVHYYATCHRAALSAAAPSAKSRRK
mmetsp:Transcript_230/g.492  ORF Transcript_230/g.492 Transcript_230/m.492 type:complete len:123 (-) Transcript_230:57-425(-)|eukprot:CAMPEP_0177660218 /NCGR_PEP_ID=MMETSP0447-20121125/17904_1 /TAXON_ID=0 /ORGANISM="Stygamoeba regulata, Strain BSH-02190019" /LENGTH=122 /DNA_ID=CAMNT_0019165231 /DNA_START=200 /DNA_END=568 /DNA_ORIENTATION=-